MTSHSGPAPVDIGVARRSATRRRRVRTLAALLTAACLTGAGVLPASASATEATRPASAPAVTPASTSAPASASLPTPTPPTIANPITDSFSDSFADPSVIRGKDGWFYLFATSDPLVAGGEFGLMHIARTLDFATYEYLGTVFDESSKPAWAAEGAFFWAPDVRYLNGEYLLYYTVTDSAAKPGADPGIGLATAPTPAGPWTDIGGPVLESRPIPGAGPEAYEGLIDPALFADDDGRLYLYVGGFNGGLRVVELDSTGRRTAGELVQTTISERFEGSYVIKHGDYYYLMVSAAGCCSAIVSGYSVFTGRSDSPLGPFVDAEGVPLNQSRAGGTQVIAANGNRWVGVGHHAVLTDLSGQDFLLYHGIDRNNGWLEEPGSINRRPTLIDRLDWIDGWPVVNAGAYASDTGIQAPVTASGLGIASAAPASNGAFRSLPGTFTAATDTSGDAGEVAELRPTRYLDALAIARQKVSGEVRLEADVRLAGDGEGEVCTRVTGLARGTTVCLDGADRQLTVTSRQGRARTVQSAAIPERIDLRNWHALSVELRAGGVHAQLSESRLNDPVAEVLAEAAAPGGSALLGLTAAGDGADIDNLSAVRAYSPVTERVPDPEAGEMFFEEEFEGEVGPGWEEVGGDTGATVSEGQLEWPLRGDDLVGGGTGSTLLREAPAGDWIAETELTLDLGEYTVRNFQQAGLIVYENDDSFLRLSSLALGAARTVEFLKEVRIGEQTFAGSHLGGPTAVTMQLRILHTTNAAGENLYRSASSVDGTNWRWGQVLVLPAGAETRIGLQAGGGAEPPVTASFDSFRFYRVAGS